MTMVFQDVKAIFRPGAGHRQVAIFALVGISSSLTYLAVLATLARGFGWGNTPSIVVAYLVGTLVSYLGSGILAFRKRMTGSNLTKFLVVVGLSFLANIAVSEVLSPLGVRAITIGIINVVFVGAFNFLCHKFWTFR
ncbi:GtrA family protein [Dyella ginsengisoli]|uniref:GtrA family protein n=1 Tax=Dyella ginsengisoli TaxID=363848 RepID=A0ABW8JTE4_9GAMM